MMPGPAPVTTIHPVSARRAARLLAWVYSGSVVSSDRGVGRLCTDCTRTNVRAIEARLDEDWW
jgi:hypothetical protein